MPSLWHLAAPLLLLEEPLGMPSLWHLSAPLLQAGAQEPLGMPSLWHLAAPLLHAGAPLLLEEPLSMPSLRQLAAALLQRGGQLLRTLLLSGLERSILQELEQKVVMNQVSALLAGPSVPILLELPPSRDAPPLILYY